MAARRMEENFMVVDDKNLRCRCVASSFLPKGFDFGWGLDGDEREVLTNEDDET